MSRFLLAIIGLLAVWSLVNDGGVLLGQGAVRLSGAEVALATDDLDVRYRLVAQLDESFMIFGGTEVPGGNAIVHATVAGLPGDQARAVAAEHPDFHLCRSPGARQAMAWTRSLHIVAGTSGVRDEVVDALDLHEKRVRDGGPRTCLRIAGGSLLLDEVRVRADGSDLTGRLASGFGRGDFVLARDAEIVDCEALLRGGTSRRS